MRYILPDFSTKAGSIDDDATDTATRDVSCKIENIQEATNTMRSHAFFFREKKDNSKLLDLLTESKLHIENKKL